MIKGKKIKQGVYLLLTLVCCGIVVYGYFLYIPTIKQPAPSMVLPSPAGPVIFTHELHASDDGAAISCTDCHHNASETAQDSSEMNCRACHYNDADIVEIVCSDDPTHPRCIGKQCLNCHDGEECSFCHRKRR